jgi:hypothetical protein
MLVHNRSLLNKRLEKARLMKSPTPSSVSSVSFPKYKEHTVQYLLLRVHVWCHISESAFENVFDAAPDFVDIRHRLFAESTSGFAVVSSVMKRRPHFSRVISS